MNILGIQHAGNTLVHDNGAVLISGENIVGISSERLDRIKRSTGYKIKKINGKNIAYDYDLCENAITYCLNYLNVKEIDLLVYLGGDEEYLKKKYNPKKIVCLNSHHLAHATSSYFASAFKEAAVLVMDGSGKVKKNGKDKMALHSIYKGEGNNIELLKDTIWTKRKRISLGTMYFIITKLIGLNSEGSTMGLSSYGKPNSKFDYFEFFKKYDGHIYLNDEFIKWAEEEKYQFLSPAIMKKFFGYTKRDIKNMILNITNSELADIAYKLQKEVEKYIIDLANEAYKLTKSKNLCISGGVGLNCIANKLILDNTPFEKIFISPPTDDSGLALGCALYGKNIINNDKNRFIMKNAFLGKEYSITEIKNSLLKYKKYIYEIKEKNDIFKITAELISKGKIIGWFHGGSEIGPRALGHRSIIGDPRDIKIRDKINNIKDREKWRPLAPIILENYMSDYFDINHPSHFMLLVAKVKDKVKKEIPGIIHIDQTARIQTVVKESSKEFYYLLKEFNKITGVPVLINTSFNFSGEPIVETPEDAIKSFLSSKLDYLVINNLLITKKRVFKEFNFSYPDIMLINEKERIFNNLFSNNIVELLKSKGVVFKFKENGDILCLSLSKNNIYIGDIYISLRMFRKDRDKLYDLFLYFNHFNNKHSSIKKLLYKIIKINYNNIYNYLIWNERKVDRLNIYQKVYLFKLKGFFDKYNDKYINLDGEFDVKDSIKNIGKNLLIEGNGLFHGDNIVLFINRLYKESIKNNVKLYLYCSNQYIYNYIFQGKSYRKNIFKEIYIGKIDKNIIFDNLLSNFYTEDFFKLALLKNIKKLSIIEWHLGSFFGDNLKEDNISNVFNNYKYLINNKTLDVYHGHADDDNTIGYYYGELLSQIFNKINIKFIGYPVDTLSLKPAIKTYDYIFSGGNNRRDFNSLINIAKYIDNKIIIRTKKDGIKYYNNGNIDISKCSYNNFILLEKKSKINCLLLDTKKYQMGGVSTLVEMMALGTVIIATKHPSINPYIIDGYNGFLIDMYDKKNLKKHIKELNKNDKLRKIFAKNARDYAEKYMDYNIIIYDIFNNL